MNYRIAVVIIIMALRGVRRAQARRCAAYIDALQFHATVLNRFREERASLSAAPTVAADISAVVPGELV